jgi:phosphocarrier protein
MKQFNYTITDPEGIHARPAGVLVKEAKKYSSAITIEKDGKKANLKTIFAVMGLAAKCGNTVTITVDGDDEDTAAAAIEEFFKANL